MKTPSDMQSGVEHKMNLNGRLKVVSYNSHRDVTVRFVDTGYLTKTSSNSIRKGTVKDRLRPCVYGVGYIGQGKYNKVDNLKCYETWNHMLERCYSDDYHRIHPTYKGCSVCEEWQDFQNFAEWFYDNYESGKCLDKDIKSGSSRGKLYSPEFCCFVSNFDNVEHSQAASYRIQSPDGDIHNVFNLSKFCRDNGLHQSAMSRVVNGKQPYHKGWTRA